MSRAGRAPGTHPGAAGGPRPVAGTATTIDADLLACPAPLAEVERVILGHGSGGQLSAALLRDLIGPALGGASPGGVLNDAAVVEVGGLRLAFTTDSYVVSPIRFPGGDIGELAVNGTVNDLAMMGAAPVAISLAYVIEEGLPLEELRELTASAARAALRAGVQIVTGDTKVVNRGGADGVFINTAGLGRIPEGVNISGRNARPGDKVLVSGSIGDHGIAILSSRAGFEFSTRLESDCAPLNGLVARMLEVSREIHCLRDPTRGGLSTTLNELARQSQAAIWIEESRIPVREEVRGACELLGLDPFILANEGKLIAIVDGGEAGKILAAMRAHPLGKDAALIGEVREAPAERVLLRTPIGSTRVMDMLVGEPLPRIC
jgi:hydrogenase expression/formation protein HypE